MTQNVKIRLLNPGPVTLSRRVRAALHQQDLCHRQWEFSQLQADVIERLASVYMDASHNYAVVLFTGSGTAAVEAMVGSLVPRKGKALVAANGVYGERMASILKKLDRPFDMVRSDWIEPIHLDELENKLRKDKNFTHVIAVHHETTTGRLNDIDAVGELCSHYGVGLLLDSVSSFGGQWTDFKKWNMDGLASTANKCLHGIPGISFVLVKNEILHTHQSNSSSVYLDLFSNYRTQATGFPQFTPAIQVLYVLQEALKELEENGGWKQRLDRYRRLSRILREKLRERGIGLLLGHDRVYSSCLSSFVLPHSLNFNNLFDHMKKRNFIIYPGQQMFKDLIFRISVMGELLDADILDFIHAFDEIGSTGKQSAKTRFLQ